MDTSTPNLRPVTLLSLDGGGFRVYSEALLIRTIIDYITYYADEPTMVNDMRPCNFFTLIGGIGAGGILAVLLGRLKMTLGEADAAFRKFIMTATDKSRGEAALGEAISELLTDAGVTSEEPFVNTEDIKSNQTGHTLVWLPDESQDFNLRCETSWKDSTRSDDDMLTIWNVIHEAAVTAGNFSSKSGKVHPICNNPTLRVIHKAEQVWENHGIACIVSLGAGKLPIFRDNTSGPSNLEVEVSVSSQQVHQHMRRDKHHGAYFRFDVEQGMSTVSAETLGHIKSHTESYISDAAVTKNLEAIEEIYRAPGLEVASYY